MEIEHFFGTYHNGMEARDENIFGTISRNCISCCELPPPNDIAVVGIKLHIFFQKKVQNYFGMVCCVHPTLTTPRWKLTTRYTISRNGSKNVFVTRLHTIVVGTKKMFNFHKNGNLSQKRSFRGVNFGWGKFLVAGVA